jgi:hypothetical protein
MSQAISVSISASIVEDEREKLPLLKCDHFLFKYNGSFGMV